MNDYPTDFDRRLHQLLYRFDCPDGEALGNYHLGLADAESAAVLERHLAKCPRCQADLATLVSFMAQEDQPAGLAPAPQPQALLRPAAPAAPLMRLRGAAQPRPLTFTFTDELTLYVSMRIEGGSLLLDGQFAATESQEAGLQGGLVEMWQAEQLAATTFVDAQASFRAELPQVADTLLRIRRPMQPTLNCLVEVDASEEA